VWIDEESKKGEGLTVTGFRERWINLLHRVAGIIAEVDVKAALPSKNAKKGHLKFRN